VNNGNDEVIFVASLDSFDAEDSPGFLPCTEVWPKYPWQDSTEQVEVEIGWHEILRQRLPHHQPIGPPDWNALRVVLYSTPFNLKPPEVRELSSPEIISLLQSVSSIRTASDALGDVHDTNDQESDGDIASVLENIPPLDTANVEWIKNKGAAEIEGLDVRTLSDYRSQGTVAADKLCGVDRDGRAWRRHRPTTHPWYLKATLLRIRSNP
jgi:hypothetical protein